MEIKELDDLAIKLAKDLFINDEMMALNNGTWKDVLAFAFAFSIYARTMGSPLSEDAKTFLLGEILGLTARYYETFRKEKLDID